jgi:hypothetical protein
MFTTKNQNLDLNAFLYSVTCSFNKKINKHFNNKLDNTNNVKFSLNSLLDFDLIKNHNKLCICFCTNITFKFMVGLNIQLIFDYFYAPRKK